MDGYEFLDDLVLRTPLFSYRDYNLNDLPDIVNNESFKAALFLANPSLYQLVAAKNFEWANLSPKEKLTVPRYYNRMCYRPTPFGAFAAFFVGKWGKGSTRGLSISNANRLHLWLDQEIAYRLANALTDQNTGEQLYVLNPTIYVIDREIRFIKTIIGDQPKFEFSIESMDDNRLISALMDFIRLEPRSGSAIAGLICQMTGCEKDVAREYVDFMIDAQLIRSLWDSNISGEDRLARILKDKRVAESPFKEELAGIYRALNGIHSLDVSIFQQVNVHINKLLAETGNVGSTQVFYASLEGSIQEGHLDNHFQQDIRGALKALSLLVKATEPVGLRQFIADFKRRYDRQRVPLLQALDPEFGIGYGGAFSSKKGSDLLRDIRFNNVQEQQQTVDWTMAHRLLFRKWSENTATGSPLLINEQDISELQAAVNDVPPPPSFPVMFRILDNHVFLESAGAASAIGLIGRFTLLSDETTRLARHIAELEQAANPEVIFAEIGQLSGHHVDNISRRQVIYPFEIPINVVSVLPQDKQLPLSDLFLSVRNDELILESQRLNRRVIPRMSSAFNYNHNELAIFRLLCDLQYHGVQANLTLNLEQIFPGMNFYPRVNYQNTILSLAKWYLNKKQLAYLQEGGVTDFPRRLNKIKQQLSLPETVAITQFDQQIVFNLSTRQDQLFFLDCIRGAGQLQLQEYPIAKETSVRYTDGKPLTGQYIALLYNKNAVYRRNHLNEVMPALAKVVRDYMLGSQWIYLKIYCHPGSANQLLVQKILPRIRAWEPRYLLSWFFIRYIDSGHHIRLRLRVKDDAHGLILRELKANLGGALHFQLVREYQADTYRRELERYGADIIEQAEDLFWASSELILAYIRRSLAKGFMFSYHSLAFVTVCGIVETCWMSLDEQITFLQQISGSFYAEFSADKSLRIDLDLKYRSIKNEMTGLLKNNAYFRSLRIMKWAESFWSAQNRLLAAAKAFSTDRKTQLWADLIHMHLNRLFTDKQRNQELIVYYCLYKYKITERALRK